MGDVKLETNVNVEEDTKSVKRKDLEIDVKDVEGELKEVSETPVRTFWTNARLKIIGVISFIIIVSAIVIGIYINYYKDAKSSKTSKSDSVPIPSEKKTHYSLGNVGDIKLELKPITDVATFFMCMKTVKDKPKEAFFFDDLKNIDIKPKFYEHDILSSKNKEYIYFINDINSKNDRSRDIFWGKFIKSDSNKKIRLLIDYSMALPHIVVPSVEVQVNYTSKKYDVSIKVKAIVDHRFISIEFNSKVPIKPLLIESIDITLKNTGMHLVKFTQNVCFKQAAIHFLSDISAQREVKQALDLVYESEDDIYGTIGRLLKLFSTRRELSEKEIIEFDDLITKIYRFGGYFQDGQTGDADEFYRLILTSTHQLFLNKMKEDTIDPELLLAFNNTNDTNDQMYNIDRGFYWHRKAITLLYFQLSFDLQEKFTLEEVSVYYLAFKIRNAHAGSKELTSESIGNIISGLVGLREDKEWTIIKRNKATCSCKVKTHKPKINGEIFNELRVYLLPTNPNTKPAGDEINYQDIFDRLRGSYIIPTTGNVDKEDTQGFVDATAACGDYMESNEECKDQESIIKRLTSATIPHIGSHLNFAAEPSTYEKRKDTDGNIEYVKVEWKEWQKVKFPGAFVFSDGKILENEFELTQILVSQPGHYYLISKVGPIWVKINFGRIEIVYKSYDEIAKSLFYNNGGSNWPRLTAYRKVGST